MTGPYAAQMNIEAIAREAGFYVGESDYGPFIEVEEGLGACSELLERFAALVRAQALEESARVCEASHPPLDGSAQWMADAIRAIAATKQQAQT